MRRMCHIWPCYLPNMCVGTGLGWRHPGPVAADRRGSGRPPVRVFISYAHASADHVQAGRQLWQFLRAQGVDARLDMAAGGRPGDWALGILEQDREADYVLVVASGPYRRRAEGLATPDESRGVPYEAA